MRALAMLALWCAVLLLPACSYESRTELTEEYDGPLSGSFQSTHVNYANKVLKIDGQTVALPAGERLHVKYGLVNGTKAASVQVDGKEVATRAAK